MGGQPDYLRQSSSTEGYRELSSKIEYFWHFQCDRRPGTPSLDPMGHAGGEQFERPCDHSPFSHRGSSRSTMTPPNTLNKATSILHIDKISTQILPDM